MGDLKKFGEYIRDLRGDRSQDDVAIPVGMTGSGWSLIENASREPKMSTLIKMARALNTSEDRLIAVFKGEESKSEQAEYSSQVVQEIINVLLKTVPHRVFAEALVKHDGPEKVREYLKQAMEGQK
jgi:transcriptional regulator with XRE-family HTH domain